MFFLQIILFLLAAVARCGIADGRRTNPPVRSGVCGRGTIVTFGFVHSWIIVHGWVTIQLNFSQGRFVTRAAKWSAIVGVRLRRRATGSALARRRRYILILWRASIVYRVSFVVVEDFLGSSFWFEGCGLGPLCCLFLENRFGTRFDRCRNRSRRQSVSNTISGRVTKQVALIHGTRRDFGFNHVGFLLFVPPGDRSYSLWLLLPDKPRWPQYTLLAPLKAIFVGEFGGFFGCLLLGSLRCGRFVVAEKTVEDFFCNILQSHSFAWERSGGRHRLSSNNQLN
mmetsp:Transcript_68058/g.102652  ORF Transcript_68058/g.102652 Transcript_68058/m.102652 type:complete len:282 (-) Transcript_68058:108-953(-)